MDAHITHTSKKGYIFAFLSSIALTLAAYFLVENQLLVGPSLVFTIVALGIVQVIIQLVFFLYLGKEKRPRSNLLVFLFMALVLVILIAGTIWIMNSLNTRVMPPMEM
jgi:cytochrome o ubiquinol oxidase operon protein cyoD